MTSIPISVLPLVSGINDDDVIVINEHNLVTSGITLRDFTEAFVDQDLEFTGEITFHGDVEINNDLEVNGEANFNNNVVFNEPVVFKNTITIENFDGVNLDDLGDVEAGNPEHLDLIVYNKPFDRWETNGDIYLRRVQQDIQPGLGGNLNTNGYKIFSDPGSSIELVPGNSYLLVRGHDYEQGNIRITSELATSYIDLTVPPSRNITPYTFTLPFNGGQPSQVLATDGTGRTFWTDNAGAGGGNGIAFDDLRVVELAPLGPGKLTYNNNNGTFFYNPTDLSSVAGILYEDLSVVYTPPFENGDLQYDKAGTFTFTPADLTDYITGIDHLKIGELLDVNDQYINSGQTLVFDEVDGMYKPGNAGAEYLDDLLDTNVPNPNPDDYLQYDDIQGWVARPLDIASAIIFKGVCELTKPISDPANVNVDPATNEPGFFWINIDNAKGPIDASWDGLSGDAIGLEYVVYTNSDDYYILGKTGDLAAILEIREGIGIEVDETPDAQRPYVGLTDTGVTPGKYLFADVTVDVKGRITDIEDGDTVKLLEDYARLDGADFTGEISVGGNFHVDTNGCFISGPLKYPCTDGQTGQAIITDGAGTLYFDDVGNVNHVGPTPPGAPEEGDLWFDDISGILYIWYTDQDSSQWVSVGGKAALGSRTFISNVEPDPESSESGDMWVNRTDYQMYVFDDVDNAWHALSTGEASGGGGNGSSISFDDLEELTR